VIALVVTSEGSYCQRSFLLLSGPGTPCPVVHLMESIAITGPGGVVMKCNYLESGHNHRIEPASGGLKCLARRMKTAGVKKCVINSRLQDDEPDWQAELDAVKYTVTQCTVTTGSRLFGKEVTRPVARPMPVDCLIWEVITSTLSLASIGCVRFSFKS